MTQLGPTARSLVAAARRGLPDPDAATAARVRAKIAASIAGAAAVTATSTTTASTAPVIGATSLSLALKLGFVVVVIAAAVGTAVVIDRASSPRVSAPAIAASASDDEPRTTVHVAIPDPRPDLGQLGGPNPGRPDSGHPDLERPSIGRPDILRNPDSVLSPSVVHESEQPNPGHQRSALSLAREVELLDRAMGELRRADLAAALATIAIYERETAGRGQLAEDATAIAIEAHCRLHDSVTDMLDVFDRTWPSSAQRARLAAACRH